MDRPAVTLRDGMAASLAFRLATFLLAYDGLAALVLSGLLGLLPATLVGALILLSWWRDRLSELIGIGPRLGQVVIVVVAAASLFDLLYVAESSLDGFVRLLLFLLLYRLFTHRSLRDARDVGFLSFFMLVGASSVTFDVAFLFVFLGFLVLGVWGLMLQHVLTEAERVAAQATVGAVAPRVRLGPALLALSLAAAAGTLAMTAIFFFVIPRVGQAALPLRARLGVLVSGFSDRVELGAFGDIQTDGSVVMRVQFPEGPLAPERLPNLRWRGIAFDHFDGRAWRVGRPERRTVERAPSGRFELDRYRGRGPMVTQEIYLEPIGTDVVFAAPRLLALSLPAESITLDDMDSVAVATPGARLRYVAYSELEMTPRPDAPDAAPLLLDERARYLQLPLLPGRVADLAREVTVGSRGPYDAAARLTAFLSREFRYTLSLSRQTALEPLEEFLFVRRSGNCEYFAAALAVMLRSVGIPARVVNGFQRGEWNPYGRYFMVRQRDAHSWVEAHIDGMGWITLDPSPRADGSGPIGASSLGLYLDALHLRWYRYVVNWSLRDQVLVAVTFQRETSAWRERLRNVRGPADVPRPSPVWGAVLVAGAVAFVVWRRRPGGSSRRVAPVPRFYARALRALARQGLRPDADETAREFLARVSRATPAWAGPLGRLTAAYERMRFGATPLEGGEVDELDGCLAALEGRVRP